jgi:hypothetical protein
LAGSRRWSWSNLLNRFRHLLLIELHRLGKFALQRFVLQFHRERFDALKYFIILVNSIGRLIHFFGFLWLGSWRRGLGSWLWCRLWWLRCSLFRLGSSFLRSVLLNWFGRRLLLFDRDHLLLFLGLLFVGYFHGRFSA